MSSSRIKQLKKVIRYPRILLSRIVMLEAVSKQLSDVTYLKWVYYLRTGKHLDLDVSIRLRTTIQAAGE